MEHIGPREFETLPVQAKKISDLIQKLVNYLQESEIKALKFKKENNQAGT